MNALQDEIIGKASEAIYMAERGARSAITGEELTPWLETPGWVKVDMEIHAQVCLELELEAAKGIAAHEGWRGVIEDMGWVYGPEFSLTEKTHPMLLPYAGLTANQKLKYPLYLSVVEYYKPEWDRITDPVIITVGTVTETGRDESLVAFDIRATVDVELCPTDAAQYRLEIRPVQE